MSIKIASLPNFSNKCNLRHLISMRNVLSFLMVVDGWSVRRSDP